MKPTPEQVERAREIIAQYKRQNMGAPMPSIEERRANLEMAIAQALADEAERARRDKCYSEYKRGFDEGYAQGTPEENAELQSQLATLQKLCEEQKSQLATQTEITEDWKKKYEEYSTYCIALVDCEKEKATQTERVRVLREALIKVKKVYISNVGHTDEGIPHKHCEVCWIDQALQDSLGDGK